MSTLTIGYDLNKPGRDYGPLTEAIKNLASNGRWWHHLDSTWIVVTDVGAGTARDSLKKTSGLRRRAADRRRHRSSQVMDRFQRQWQPLAQGHLPVTAKPAQTGASS